jgi:hypothetical protein
MKKQIFILVAICVISVQLSNVQSQTLYVPSGTSGIGSSSNGNVGIGTSTPIAKLHVNGNVYVDTNELQFLGASSGINRIKSNSGSVFGTWEFKSIYDNIILDAGSNSDNKRSIFFRIGGSDRLIIDPYIGGGRFIFLGSNTYPVNLDLGGSDGHALEANSATLLYLNKNGAWPNLSIGGKVGIGTILPGNTLSVTEAAGVTCTLPALGANGGTLGVFSNGASYGLIGGSLGSGNSFLQVQRVDGTATAYDLLLQPTAGKVGIGTTTPNNKLHLYTSSGPIGMTLQTGTSYSYVVNDGNNIILASDQGTTGFKLLVNRNAPDNSMAINSIGNVGIGTTSPQSKLHVTGNQSINWQETDDAKGTALVTIGDRGGNGSLFINTPTHTPYYPAGLGIDGSYDSNSWTSTINIKAFGVKYMSWHSVLAFHTSNGASINEAMRIDPNSNVGIGTTHPAYKLDVFGTIRAKEVKVDLNGVADFVFKPDYQLRPLSEVEKYIKANSHLPEIPSAAEVAQNGLSLGDMQNKLLQKVEELTLYSIEQEKKNAELQREINELKELVNQKLK